MWGASGYTARHQSHCGSVCVCVCSVGRLVGTACEGVLEGLHSTQPHTQGVCVLRGDHCVCVCSGKRIDCGGGGSLEGLQGAQPHT